MSAPPPPGCPAHAAGPMPLYGQEFAADPHRAYAALRETHGSLAPVLLAPGVPATLVIGYDAARQILNSPEHFPSDPREWQQTVPADCPVLPMMEWRPNALRNSGAVHTRYRAATSDSLAHINPHQLRDLVERSAATLIGRFCEHGEADVIADYARPLPFMLLTELFGCPPGIGERVATGMSRIFDGVDAENSNAMLAGGLTELVALKRRSPGRDVTSRLLAHQARLTDEEAVHQLVTLLGAGTEPLQNLIGNTVWLMLSDERFSGDLLDGSLSALDALDETLFKNPPMSNYCITYPVQDIDTGGLLLRAHQPVVISMAAANSDPAVASADADTIRARNASHLAWSTGPHACPAQMPARLIAEVAIAQLLDAVPDLRLAGPVDWRPSPFQRALSALPVAFPPVPPVGRTGPARYANPVSNASSANSHEGASPWSSANPSFSTPQEATSMARPPASGNAGRSRLWNFLAGSPPGR